MDQAEALRQAQLTVMRSGQRADGKSDDYSSPFCWAAFVLIGEYQVVGDVKKDTVKAIDFRRRSLAFRCNQHPLVPQTKPESRRSQWNDAAIVPTICLCCCN